MIRNWQEAFGILGLMPGVSFEDCRKAYKLSIKSLHPDNNDSSINNSYYLVTEAFEYLSELNDNGLWSMTAPSASSNRGTKIIGTPIQKSSANDNARKAMRLYKESKQKEAKTKQQELINEAARKKEEERLKQEQELLEEIKWMRIAGIISDTIASDNKQKDIDNKLKYAFAQHDKNVMNDRYRKSEDI